MGIRLSIHSQTNVGGESELECQNGSKNDDDLTDGSGCGRGGDYSNITASSVNCYSDNNNLTGSKLDEIVNDDLIEDNFKNSSNAVATASNGAPLFYHIPSLCDMLIGFPTQKGFIAYRKPEIGSWYMNAIVQVFSKHSHDTDLCAMLNMVNSLISNEVTNTGKKQMSEYTSKLTKPYFHFFPGFNFRIFLHEDGRWGCTQ